MDKTQKLKQYRNEYFKKYYEKNREKIIENCKKRNEIYYNENYEYYQEYSKHYYKANRDYFLDYIKKWKQDKRTVNSAPIEIKTIHFDTNLDIRFDD